MTVFNEYHTIISILFNEYHHILNIGYNCHDDEYENITDENDEIDQIYL